MARYHIRITAALVGDRRGLSEAPAHAAAAMIVAASEALAKVGITLEEPVTTDVYRTDKMVERAHATIKSGEV